VNDLVALDLPAGPEWVRRLVDCWEAGDAVLPVDGRLPPPAKDALYRALEPTGVVEHAGPARRPGRGVEDGDALVVATSGTTGEPKGAVLTHDAVAASARATSSRLAVDPTADRWLACLPLAHVGGLSVVTRALVTGTPLEVHAEFDTRAVEDAARRGCTLVSLVATALSRIDPTLFRVIVLGGSRPPATRPANTVATYGMTETGSGVVYDGRPLQGVELRIDSDGEIALRAPMLLRCYRDGTVPIDADGWFRTGDLGELHPDGTLRVFGRRGDMITTGGEKVWPDTVERILADLPGVADVGVVGAPDPEWGERVVAVIVPADPSSPPSLDAVRAHVKASLPAYCAPRELVLSDRLARTALGKLVRPVRHAAAPPGTE
jgi:O-succinylbenzoic acid--CoA ligase